MLTYRDLLNVLKKWEQDDDAGMDDPLVFSDQEHKLHFFNSWDDGEYHYKLEKCGLSGRNTVMVIVKAMTLKEIEKEKEKITQWIVKHDDFFIPDGPQSMILVNFAKQAMKDLGISYEIYADYRPSGLTFYNLKKESK